MNPHLPPELLTMLAERLGWALLHSVWQGALIAAALAILLPFVRSAATRHAACLVALLLLAGALAPTSVVVRPTVTFSSSPAAAPMAADVREKIAATAGTTPAVSSPRRPVATGVASDRRPPWRERFEPMLPRLSAAWTLGVALLSLWRLLGWQRVRAMQRSGVPVRPDLQRTFSELLEKFGCSLATPLLESARVAVPMLAGLVKPVVLLPLRVVTGLRACEIEAILAHELAHLVRRDAWSNLAQVAVETLFFYHPAVWWIGRRARQERENAADDLALEICTDRRTYAGALAQLAEMECASATALAATGGSVLARIQRIVRPARIESPASGWSLCLPPLLAALALAFTTIFRAEAEPAKPPVTAEQGAAKSAELSKPWIADAFQLDDKTKREAAIERIRTAMQSTDADEARAGVSAFGRIAAVEFDKPPFRPAVRALLASSDAPTRAAAARAIAIIGAEPGDLSRILGLADDSAEEVRAVLTGVIVQITKRDLRDRDVSDAILKLMATLPRDSRRVSHNLWGAKFSPEIEASVLEFSRGLKGASNDDTGYNFFYGSLSTQANKSEASCRRLIELLAHEDITNIAGRAAWGLQQGVDRAQHELVADAMLKVIEARSEGYLRKQALSALGNYASTQQAPAIKALLAKPGVDGDLRKSLEVMFTTIDGQSANAGAKLEITSGQNSPRGLERTAAGDAANLIEAKRLEIESLKAHLAKPGLDGGFRQSLQRALARLEASPNPEDERLREANQLRARRRAGADSALYSQAELAEIESLYQVANKNWRTPEARESLKKLLEKFDRSNRTGCATLYMGQMSEGPERLDYLTRAVEKFSDCYYLDGCQVGGYGRYVLAIALWEKDGKEKARAVLDELKTQFAGAIDHRGQPMSRLVEELEAKWAVEK